MSFRENVRPTLIERCGQCHGGQLGLYVDSYDALLAGSSRTKVLLSGDPERSVLIRRIRGDLQPRMPLGASPLSEDEITIIETWIREGAANN